VNKGKGEEHNLRVCVCVRKHSCPVFGSGIGRRTKKRHCSHSKEGAGRYQKRRLIGDRPGRSETNA
jgi:hypothetical protein